MHGTEERFEKQIFLDSNDCKEDNIYGCIDWKINKADPDDMSKAEWSDEVTVSFSETE